MWVVGQTKKDFFCRDAIEEQFWFPQRTVLKKKRPGFDAEEFFYWSNYKVQTILKTSESSVLK